MPTTETKTEPRPPDADEAPAPSPIEELEILFPGRKVSIGNGELQCEITVMPMLVRHIRDFAAPIEAAIGKLTTDGVDFTKLGESWPLLIKHLAPLLINDLFDLLNECADMELNDLPHWVLPDVAGAWLDENFGSEEKLRPWFEVVSKILEKVSTEKVDLWGSVSKALLRPGTTDET